LYPLDRRLGGPQGQAGQGGEEKNSQPLMVLEHPITQPAAQRYTTELSSLIYMTDKAIKSVHMSWQDYIQIMKG